MLCISNYKQSLLNYIGHLNYFIDGIVNSTILQIFLFTVQEFQKKTEMELFRTTEYYIFRQGEHSLWCNRKTGHLEPRTG
jgi:hypothetical protein